MGSEYAPACIRLACALSWLGLLAVAPVVTVAWVVLSPRKKGG